MTKNRNEAFAQMLRPAVVPVITVEEPDGAVALARALSDGGLPVIEVTLRTSAALACIGAIARELSGRVVVGAGTVRSPQDAEMAIQAGSAFLVSPGVTPSLVQAAMSWRVPYLPGVATASEAMALADMGFQFQKFFPAEASGGADALAALAAPLPDISFCPTGGVGAANASRYLSLANVVCVGGSWVAPRDAVEAGDWARVTELAAAAAAMKPD